MQCLGILPLFLLLPAVIRGDFPDFDDEDDGYDEYYVCEGEACVYRSMYLYFEQNIQVPNKSVTYEEYEYFDVDKAGLLTDCAPSLSVGDIATTIKSCKEVDRKYRDACKYRKKGWLGQDGKTVNDSLVTAFDEIEGVSENIAKCLEWDGMDDYDYNYYGDYDYHYLEEFDNTQVRTKRDLKMNVPEFMKQKIRNRRGAKEKKNNGEPQSGTRSRNVKKKKPKKDKNRSRNRNKGKTQRNNKKGRNGKVGNKGNKKPKIKRNKNRKGNKSGKKGKTRNNNKKKGERKKTKDEKKKEEKKKKKEEKKERKMLKQIDLDSKPSDEILNKLECVERAIEYGLEKCGEKIFTNLDLH